MSWLDGLKEDGGADPTDGNHTATLVHSAILDTRNGTRIKTEWQTVDLAFYWESWQGVEGGQRQFARNFLTGLGLDLDRLTSEDQVADALAAVEGQAFLVNVTRNGNFFNTRVLEKPDGVQTAIPVPAAPPTPPRSAIFDDDDIPF